MRIRVQPLEIEVPGDNPFKNDLLDREEQVEILTNIVRKIEGPCVLAVDAAWGTGKTTFIKIWEQFLRNHQFPVVRINAWETDYSGDPFIALTSELAEGLSGCTEPTQQEKVEAFKDAAKKVLRRVAPGMVRLLASNIPIVGGELSHELGSYLEGALSEHPEVQRSVKEFRNKLQEMAAALSTPEQNRPVVVFIDELDRCRPTYAIELLEVAKHFFSVDNMVFVLAVNREQLAHSVKAVYGSSFDANGYLSRFFDADFLLPDPDRTRFMFGLLNATKVLQFLEPPGAQTSNGAGPVSTAFVRLFCSTDLGLRDIAQAVHRVGLVFLSLSPDQPSTPIPALILILLRTINQSLYRRFVDGAATDEDVVSEFSSRVQDKLWHNELAALRIEAWVMVGAQEFTNPNWQGGSLASSALLESYRRIGSDETKNGSEKTRAGRVIKLAEQIANEYQDSNLGNQRFRTVAQRLELLSPDLSRFTAEEPSLTAGTINEENQEV